MRPSPAPCQVVVVAFPCDGEEPGSSTRDGFFAKRFLTPGQPRTARVVLRRWFGASGAWADAPVERGLPQRAGRPVRRADQHRRTAGARSPSSPGSSDR
jgi:hypothetical protein